MDKTNIKVEFTIVGKDDKFLPSIASDLLVITPTIIGQVIRVTNRGKELLAKDNSWEIETDYEESVDSRIQINKVLSQLKGKEDILRRIYDEYDVEIILMIVLQVEEWIHPCLDLDSDLIKYLDGINAVIRYDQYYYDDNLPDSFDEFNYTSEYKIILMIEGKETEVTSSEISERLGIEQRKYQEKECKDKRKYNKKDVIWQYEYDYDRAFEITHTMDSLLETFADKEIILQQIYNDFDVKVTLLITMILKNGEYPCTDFLKKHIEFLSKINSSICYEQHYVFSPHDFVASIDY